jgi:hypothetical protein
MFNNTPVDSRTNDHCWRDDPKQPRSYQSPRLVATSSYVPDCKAWPSDCYTWRALSNCYKQMEVTSKLSTSLRISDCILRITGTNTSGPIHINCDNFRIAIWQIMGPFVLVFRYFESQRRDQPWPYEKWNPQSWVIATQAVITSGHKITRPPPSTLFYVTHTRLCCVEFSTFWSSDLISLEAMQCWHDCITSTTALEC